MTGRVHRAGRHRYKGTLPRAAPAQQIERANQDKGPREETAGSQTPGVFPRTCSPNNFCSLACALLSSMETRLGSQSEHPSTLRTPASDPLAGAKSHGQDVAPKCYKVQPRLARCSRSLTQIVLSGLEVCNATLVLFQLLPPLPLCKSKPSIPAPRCRPRSTQL